MWAASLYMRRRGRWLNAHFRGTPLYYKVTEPLALYERGGGLVWSTKASSYGSSVSYYRT